MKKQIVFVEYISTIPTLQIAKTLKNTGKYETILVSFSKINKELLKGAFDKFFVLKISHKLNLKNLIDFLKKIKNKETKIFFKNLKQLNPYLFQITGPDLFTYLFMLRIRKKQTPKIYFAYDIWEFFNKKFSLKNLGIKEFFQKKFEKKCFKIASGILHKGPSEELKLLKYKITVPDLSFNPGCFDEWINKPLKKKNKELHLVYAGGPLAYWNGRVPFLKITRIITSQKIHFHTYGPCVVEKDNKIFAKEEKINKYFHFHKKKPINKLNKELSKYDYGILPDFYDVSIINPLWPKTTMANKMFNYISAGIPLIMNKQMEFMSDIIKKNNIGFSIKYEDLKNLKKIIEKHKKNYKKFTENIQKAQEKFKISKNIKKIENFYEKIAKLEKSKNKNMQ